LIRHVSLALNLEKRSFARLKPRFSPASVEPEKAASPMVVTLDGIVMETR
jgi:hypothetical protein